jgi:hypothetical protein
VGSQEGIRICTFHQLSLENPVYPVLALRNYHIVKFSLDSHLLHSSHLHLSLILYARQPHLSFSLEFDRGLLTQFCVSFFEFSLANFLFELSDDLIGCFEALINLLVLATALGRISGSDKVRHLFEYFANSVIESGLPSLQP